MKLIHTGAQIKEEVLYGLEAYISDDEYKDGKLIQTPVGHNPPEDGAIILVQKAINQIIEKL